MTTLGLSTIDARLDWAASHASRVRDLTQEWAGRAIAKSSRLDTDRGYRVDRFEVQGDPPPEVALALGDVLHHARAALDNLVGVLRGGATGRSAFRIDTDPALFDRDTEDKLEGSRPGPWSRSATSSPSRKMPGAPSGRACSAFIGWPLTTGTTRCSWGSGRSTSTSRGPRAVIRAKPGSPLGTSTRPPGCGS